MMSKNFDLLLKLVIYAMLLYGKKLLKMPTGKLKAEGIDWIQTAAEKGSVQAMQTLGQAYLFGKGTNRNVSCGLSWLEKASENDSISSMVRLGKYFLEGIFSELQPQLGVEWLVKSTTDLLLLCDYIAGVLLH
ncbi:tetratricopeptide repeat protein [Shimazuella alba]|uniref:Sel1 repeat family protein n=1 Tax=Shimazuella alba TaxID=2690964 RepID=A0A6I4VMX5_9BACL|nr:SEL1-like repeat protein [Shimazuella alba]MXQ52393.1 hypothetical protein [Shimazuella alba]